MASKNISTNNKLENNPKNKLNHRNYGSADPLQPKKRGLIRRKLDKIRAFFKSSTPPTATPTRTPKQAIHQNLHQHSDDNLRRSDLQHVPVRSYSLFDLSKPDQSACSKPLVPQKVTNVFNGTIRISFGDITKQTTDAIVVASTSDNLREYVLQQAGGAIKTIYDTEKQQKLSTSICTNGGNLSCKRIYFIPCPRMSKNADRWIFRNFVSDAFRLATHDTSTNIQSIAFPAIGCGSYGCDTNFVAKTLITAVAYELEHQPSLKFDVHFIIRQNQQTIFNAFKSEVIALKNNKPTQSANPPSTIVPHLPPKFPKHQSIDNQSSSEKRLLDKSSNEYTRIVKEFTATMTSNHYTTIVRIEVVWNERWYRQYEIHKKHLLQRLQNDTEKRLFHGCSEHAANSIIEGGFDRSYAGEHGTSYGCGVYFSSRASYSHSYATPNSKGERCMFLAKVLIGKPTQGNPSMMVCPHGYDSTTNGSHIHVIYHDAQAFGNYLITYK